MRGVRFCRYEDGVRPKGGEVQGEVEQVFGSGGGGWEGDAGARAELGEDEGAVRAGATVYVSPAVTSGRKTAFDLRLVSIDGVLVSCDSRLPPSLVAEAQRLGRLAEFAGYPVIERERTFGESRLDLCFSGPRGRVYVETKSATLVRGGRALFPDAPTTRGTKHVRTLMKAVDEGYGAAVVFVVQRDDATCLSPNRDADPEFTSALEEAQRKGVGVYAYGCRVTTEEISLGGRVPVEFR